VINVAKQKKLVTYQVDPDFKEEISEYSKRTGMRRSDMNRQAMRKFLDEGHSDALMMLNIVQLVQVVNDMQKEIKPEHVEQLQSLTENLVKIKGGK
jgi:metal-responsive CopG/Arc/MetJ family transcriptional regulator